MGRQIVEHDADAFGFRIMEVSEFANADGEFDRRATRGDFHLAPGTVGVEEHEQIGGSVAPVLAVVALDLPGLGMRSRCGTTREMTSAMSRGRTNSPPISGLSWNWCLISQRHARRCVTCTDSGRLWRREFRQAAPIESAVRPHQRFPIQSQHPGCARVMPAVLQSRAPRPLAASDQLALGIHVGVGSLHE